MLRLVLTTIPVMVDGRVDMIIFRAMDMTRVIRAGLDTKA